MTDVKQPIYGFVIAILGIIFVGIIAGVVSENTSQTAVSSETISIASTRIAGGAINESTTLTIANPVTGWRAGELPTCQINNFVLKNSTGSTMTATTHYVFNQSRGTFTLKNLAPLNNSVSNSTTVSYSYCGDGYLSSSFGRSIANTIGGFLALLIVVGIVSIVYILVRQFKE